MQNAKCKIAQRSHSLSVFTGACNDLSGKEVNKIQKKGVGSISKLKKV